MNLAVMKADHVNISVHGHNPVLSEVIVKAVADPEMKALAQKYGAKGINLVGMCCTGSELLMRKGVPMTGNHLNQELIIATGALEAMVVDYQCIFPSLPQDCKLLPYPDHLNQFESHDTGLVLLRLPCRGCLSHRKGDRADGSGELQEQEPAACPDPGRTRTGHVGILQ